MKRTIFTLLLVLSLLSCFGHLLEEKAWNTFEGKLGDKEVQLSLYLFADGTIRGNYVFRDSTNKIPVVGYPKANALFLKEVNSPAIFKGNVFSDTLDKFEGVWIDSSKNQMQQFSLKLSSITWGDFEHRYSDMYGTTEEIEGFMQKVKTAILTDDKEWIATHVRYPTRQVLAKGYTSINTKQDFIKYYDQFINAKFKEKIKHASTTNLFNKNGLAMLGDGEIWIGNTPNSTESKYDFIIFAI
jgi:hypothetical protein